MRKLQIWHSKGGGGLCLQPQRLGGGGGGPRRDDEERILLKAEAQRHTGCSDTDSHWEWQGNAKQEIKGDNGRVQQLAWAVRAPPRAPCAWPKKMPSRKRGESRNKEGGDGQQGRPEQRTDRKFKGKEGAETVFLKGFSGRDR